MDISNSIRKLRESKHLTQQEVADKLQIERSNYARFEARGKKLTIEQLENIAAALGISIIEILMDKSQSAEPSRREQELEKENETLKERVEELKQQNIALQKSVDIASKFVNNAIGFVSTNKEGLEEIISQETIPSNDIAKLAKGLINVMPDELFNKEQKDALTKKADKQMKELKRIKRN